MTIFGNKNTLYKYGENIVMGIQKVAFNFMVERGGKLAKSLLCSKPQKAVTNIGGLKCFPNNKTDAFIKKIDSWFGAGSKTTPPYANRRTTVVAGHHGFHGWNTNSTIEEEMRVFMENYPNATKEQIAKKLVRVKTNIAESNIDRIDTNRDFLKLEPQPKECTVFRGRSRYIGQQKGSDFDIIKNAQIGDEIVPTGAFAYAAHFKPQVAQYVGTSDRETIEGILYEIVVPKGSKISVNMEHNGEAVFPALSRFKLLQKETRYIPSIRDEFYKVPNAPVRPITYVKIEYIPQISVFNKRLEDMTDSEYKILLQKAMECKNWKEFADLPKILGL